VIRQTNGEGPSTGGRGLITLTDLREILMLMVEKRDKKGTEKHWEANSVRPGPKKGSSRTNGWNAS